MEQARAARGFTLLELLLALALSLAVAVAAVPMTSTALDEARTALAARYLSGRIADARMHAITRSTRVGLRFEPAEDGYRVAEYVDGNGNGVRTADIAARVDIERAPAGRLGDEYPGVTFGLRPGLPDLDDERGSGVEGVRIGSSRILTMGPDGTASSGTLYLRGVRAQFAIRVFGATGRTRVLRFDSGSGQWRSR